MQGFTDLLLPIYHVFLKSPQMSNNLDECEALSFFLFNQLLAQTRLIDLYTLDVDSGYIFTTLGFFTNILQKHFPSMAERLKKLNIQPIHYSYRWFCLLFCQDFDMNLLLMVWDQLFVHFDDLINFAFYIGVAQMKLSEEKLNDSSSEDLLVMLQNILIFDCGPLLRLAEQWWNQDHHPPPSRVKKFFSWS